MDTVAHGGGLPTQGLTRNVKNTNVVLLSQVLKGLLFSECPNKHKHFHYKNMSAEMLERMFVIMHEHNIHYPITWLLNSRMLDAKQTYDYLRTWITYWKGISISCFCYSITNFWNFNSIIEQRPHHIANYEKSLRNLKTKPRLRCLFIWFLNLIEVYRYLKTCNGRKAIGLLE